MSFGDEKEGKIFLKEPRFYNALTKNHTLNVLIT